MSKLVNVREASKALNYTPHYIRVLASNGKIPAIRRKYRWMFDLDAVREAIFSDNSYKRKGVNASGTAAKDDERL